MTQKVCRGQAVICYSFCLRKELFRFLQFCFLKRRNDWSGPTHFIWNHEKKHDLLNCINSFLRCVFISAIGCETIKNPANMWVDQKGNVAKLGCLSNNQQWEQTCEGTTWVGDIGSCPPGPLPGTLKKICPMYHTRLLLCPILNRCPWEKCQVTLYYLLYYQVECWMWKTTLLPSTLLLSQTIVKLF